MTSLQYAISDAYATEGGNLSFMVYRSGPLTSASTVYLSTSSGTATNGADFVAKTLQVLTFAIGESAKTFTIPTYMDSLVESTESMTLGLYTGASDKAYQAYGTGSIWNVAPTQASIQTPVTSYSVSSASASEGGNLSFTIYRNSGYDTSSTVYLDTNSGTATKGTDFEFKGSQSLTFNRGEFSKTFTVATYSDSLSEGAESMSLRLSTGSSGTGYQASGTGTIYNVTPAPTASYFISSASAAEGGTLSFTISRSGATSSASTVYVDATSNTAIEGTDFATQTLQALSFAAGQTTKTFAVATYKDTQSEGTEYMNLRLYTDSSGTSFKTSGTGTIYNVVPTPTPMPSYSVSNAAANEGGTLSFTINRGGATSSASTVYLNTDSGTATKGIDFASSALQALSFAAGETAKTFTIATYRDSLTESTETMKLNLFTGSTGTGLQTSATGTIYNVAPAPSYSVSNAAANEGGTLSFTINRSGTTNSASTVYLNTDSGTATKGIDFASRTMQSLSFAAGETTKTFTVSTISDFQSESLETMKLSLYTDASGSGNPASGTGYIYNVTTIPSYSVSNASSSEGGNLNFTIYRNNGYDTESTVYLNTNSGTATQGADFVSKGLQSLTFSRGEFSKTFTVATYADSITESNETLSLSLYRYSDSGYSSRWNPGPDIPGFPISSTTGLQATGTGTIYDVKPTPPIYSVEKAFAFEGDTLNFTIYRSGATDSTSTVYLDTNSGTATEGSDFASINMQALTFAPGETAKTFGIETYRDSLSESTESMNLVLYMGSVADISLASTMGFIS
jgi:hypothetical protein